MTMNEEGHIQDHPIITPDPGNQLVAIDIADPQITLHDEALMIFFPKERIATDISTSEYVVRGIALAISALSGVPYIPIAMEAVDIDWLSYILAINVVVSFAIGSSWGWQRIINELVSDKKIEDNLTTGSNLRRIITGAMSVVTGALTSMPITYFVYKNNNNKFWVIFNYFTSIGLHSYGFNIFYNTIIDAVQSENVICSSSNKMILQVREELVLLINASKVALIHEPELHSNFLQSIDSVYALSDIYSAPDVSKILVSLVDAGLAAKTLPAELFVEGMPKMVTRLLGGLIFPTASTIVNLIFAYGAASFVTSELYLIAPLVALMVLPGMFIDFYTNDKLFSGIFNQIYHCCYQHQQDDVVASSYPRYVILLGVLALSGILVALSAMRSLYDTLNEDVSNNVALGLTILTTICQGVSKIYMSFDLSSAFFELYLVKYGPDETKKLKATCDAIGALAKRLDNTSLELLDKALTKFLQHNNEIAGKLAEQAQYPKLKEYSRLLLFRDNENSPLNLEPTKSSLYSVRLC